MSEQLSVAGDQRSIKVTSVPPLDDARFLDAYDEFGRPIYNYVLRLMGSAQDAADHTQNTFMRAFAAWPNMPKDLAVKPWLFRIATNDCFNELRRRRVIRRAPWKIVAEIAENLLVDHSPQPEEEIIRLESAEQVQDVLGKLPPKYRAALLLRECQEMSCDEIGETFGVSRGAVKSLLFRAREEFRRQYKASHPDENVA